MTTVAFSQSVANRVGSAMAQQVERANDPHTKAMRLCRQHPQNAAALILALQAEVAQLKADLAAAQAGAIANAPRWCTPAEAARHLGKHVSSINRALHDGRLNGTQGSNGQWRVALPLPPSLPTRTRGRKRKAL
jgi:type IV secretory pathway VirJ component